MGAILTEWQTPQVMIVVMKMPATVFTFGDTAVFRRRLGHLRVTHRPRGRNHQLGLRCFNDCYSRINENGCRAVPSGITPTIVSLFWAHSMAHTMKSQVSFTSSTVKMSGIRIKSTTSRQMSYPFIEVKNESKSSGGRVVHPMASPRDAKCPMNTQPLSRLG